MKYTTHALSCLFTCGTLLFGGTPDAIGIATGPSEFRVNHSTVPGNATLFNGSVVETGASRSSIRLNTGGRVLLASNSSGQFRSDRVLLERGIAELSNTAGSYSVEANHLTIAPVGTGARISIARDSGDTVRVAAHEGTAEVRNRQGILVAKAMPGMALQLEAAAPQLTHVAGKVSASKGAFFVTDETTKVVVQIRGTNLQQLVGSRVAITGTAVTGEVPAAGASQIILVTSATKAGAAAVGAATATGVATKTLAIVGGVAASGTTVGSLYVADVIGGEEERPVSR